MMNLLGAYVHSGLHGQVLVAESENELQRKIVAWLRENGVDVPDADKEEFSHWYTNDSPPDVYVWWSDEPVEIPDSEIVPYDDECDDTMDYLGEQDAVEFLRDMFKEDS